MCWSLIVVRLLLSSLCAVLVWCLRRLLFISLQIVLQSPYPIYIHTHTHIAYTSRSARKFSKSSLYHSLFCCVRQLISSSIVWRQPTQTHDTNQPTNHPYVQLRARSFYSFYSTTLSRFRSFSLVLSLYIHAQVSSTFTYKRLYTTTTTTTNNAHMYVCVCKSCSRSHIYLDCKRAAAAAPRLDRNSSLNLTALNLFKQWH